MITHDPAAVSVRRLAKFLLALVTLGCASDDPLPPPVPEAPLAPTTVTAMVVDATSVTVTWAAGSTNADSFEIRRNGAVIGTVSGTASSHRDESAPDGTSLTYSVVAFNPQGHSSSTSAAPVTTPLAPPTGLTVTSKTDVSVSLEWLDNSTGNTGYDLERNGQPVVSLAADATTYTDEGLTNATEYVYRVSATKSGLAPAASGTLSAITDEEPLGALFVMLSVTGQDRDEDGCHIAVDGGPPVTLTNGGSYLFTDLAPGSHFVLLSDLAMNCSVSDNPRPVTITARQTTDATYAVDCVAQSPLQRVLGRGYNVFGKYADAGYTRSQVLDLEALYEGGLLDSLVNGQSSFATQSGRTVMEYASSFSNNTSVSGSYLYFSATVSAYFSEERFTRQEYEFATIQSLHHESTLRVDPFVLDDRLSDYLTASARDAINDDSRTPKDVFDQFGTHVMRGAIAGGRVDYSVEANMLFDQSERTIEVYARASVKAKLDLAVENTTVTTDERSTFTENSNERLEAYGGDVELRQAVADGESYRAWAATVDENPTFVDFTVDGLVPIWKLADEPGRRGALESWFMAHADGYSIELGDLKSEFSEDAEGWTSEGGDPIDYYPPGNSLCEASGCISSYEWRGRLQYFVAPEVYHGNWERFYGGALRFKHKNDRENNYYVGEDVYLSGRTANLGYFLDHEAYPKRNEWTQYHIEFKPGRQETGIWKRQVSGTWSDATEEDIRAVLSKVYVFRIKGERADTDDRGFLDRVAVCRPGDPLCNP